MTRREYLALSALAVATNCGRKRGAGFAGHALVATAGENSVTAVDLSLFRLRAQIPLNGAPRAVLTGPGKTSFVLTPGEGSLHRLDPDFQLTASKKLADQLAGFALSPDGSRLWAISGANREAFELHPATLQIARRWKLAAQPTALDVALDGSVAIVSGDSGSVERIDPGSGQRSRAELASTLGEVRFRRDGKLLVVADKGNRAISMLDSPALRKIVDLPLAMRPDHLCFDMPGGQPGGQLFVSGEGMDGIAIVFTYDTLIVEQTVLGGRDPGAMVCSTNPSYLFLASPDTSDVSILNVDSRKMIGMVEVGKRPGFVAVTTDSQYALVLNEGSGDMAIIHVGAIPRKLGDAARMRSKSAASLLTVLPVGANPVHLTIV